MYNILGTRKIWIGISTILIVLTLVFWIVWGLNPGIDFTGGSLMQLKFNNQRPTSVEIKQEVVKIPELGEPQVQMVNDDEVILKLKFISNDQRQEILQSFPDATEESFESIGPVIGKELVGKSVWAIIFVILGIVVFLSWAFRKVSSGPVPSWAYGVSAILALVHDVIITLGVFILLGHFLNIELNTMFITALLTILGYSVNDTIVVFDRIREGLKTSNKETFEQVINESINVTITRSLNTSLTTLLVLFALFFFGGATIKYFVLALIVGIISGTYSSIFIASPFLLFWQKILRR
ncbi:MAG: protein translocase subunit SecF [Patescibacteria group bacterium]